MKFVLLKYLAAVALLTAQWQFGVNAVDPDPMVVFTRRTEQLMGWTPQQNIIMEVRCLTDDTPGIWNYHSHLWRWSGVPHVALGTSEDGLGHLILVPVNPGSPLGYRYFGDFDRRFLAAEVRQGEYPILHGYLRIGTDEHFAEGRQLADLAFSNPDNLPVRVIRRVPRKYAPP